MPRRTVESRLFDAVLVVLATGCQPLPPSQPAQPTPPRGPTGSDPWESTAPRNSATGDETARVAIDPPPPPPPPASGAADTAKAKQICERYKTTLKLVTKPAYPNDKPFEPTHVQETSSWDPNKNVARCTIIRESNAGKFQVMEQPPESRCCPPADCSRQMAPQPYERTVQGTYTLVEQADVTADGALIASNPYWARQWHQREPIPLSQQPYCGRRPEGLAFDGERASASLVGAALAEMAELEAASVPAFERLARELESHGAPAALVQRARTAMRDEIRHARTMQRLAARHGGVPRAPTVPAMPLRSLAELARENAVEGCVHEAFGALVATYQAERARPELRRAFAAIARDERSHAALAEAVDAWCMRTLDDTTRAELVCARDAAVEDLRARLANHAACDELGVPGPAEARALCDAYFAAA